MAHFLRQYAIAGAALLIPSSAFGSPLDFDCDVPSNRYSSVSQELESNEAQVSGEIQAVELRSGKNLPVAGVRLSDSEESQFFGFRLIASTAKANDFEVVINSKSNGKLQQYSAGRIPSKDRVRFRVAFDGAGKAILSFGGEPIVAEFPILTKSKAMVFCSTGQFKFSNLHFVEGTLAESPRNP